MLGYGGGHPVHADDVCHVRTWPSQVVRDSAKVGEVTRWGRFLKVVLPLIGSAYLVTFVPSHDHSKLTAVSYVVTGYFIGYVVLTLLAALIVLLPPVRHRLHWTCKAQTTGLTQGYVPATYLRLTSECVHQVNGLECEVTSPEGMVAIARPVIANRSNNGRILRGSDVVVGHQTDFPELGNQPGKPAPGKYKMRWTSETRNGKKRVTLCKGTWRVTP